MICLRLAGVRLWPLASDTEVVLTHIHDSGMTLKLCEFLPEVLDWLNAQAPGSYYYYLNYVQDSTAIPLPSKPRRESFESMITEIAFRDKRTALMFALKWII